MVTISSTAEMWLKVNARYRSSLCWCGVIFIVSMWCNLDCVLVAFDLLFEDIDDLSLDTPDASEVRHS